MRFAFDHKTGSQPVIGWISGTNAEVDISVPFHHDGQTFRSINSVALLSGKI